MFRQFKPFEYIGTRNAGKSRCSYFNSLVIASNHSLRISHCHITQKNNITSNPTTSELKHPQDSLKLARDIIISSHHHIKNINFEKSFTLCISKMIFIGYCWRWWVRENVWLTCQMVLPVLDNQRSMIYDVVYQSSHASHSDLSQF